MDHRKSFHGTVNELIDSGEPRTKVVGMLRPPAAGTGADWEQFNMPQKNFPHVLNGLPFPKGVYRFKTLQESDA